MPAINPPSDARIIHKGESTEIAIWRSLYKGVPTVSVAQRHPQRTGGYWKGGVASMDAEVSLAFADAAVGWTLTDGSEPTVEPEQVTEEGDEPQTLVKPQDMSKPKASTQRRTATAQAQQRAEAKPRGRSAKK